MKSTEGGELSDSPPSPFLSSVSGTIPHHSCGRRGGISTQKTKDKNTQDYYFPRLLPYHDVFTYLCIPFVWAPTV